MVELFDIFLWMAILLPVGLFFKVGPKKLVIIVGSVIKSAPIVWDEQIKYGGRFAGVTPVDGGMVQYSVFKTPLSIIKLPPCRPRQAVTLTYPNETNHPEGVIYIMPDATSAQRGFIERYLITALDEAEIQLKELRQTTATLRKSLDNETSVSAAKSAIDSNLRTIDEVYDKFTRNQKNVKRQAQLIDASRGGKKGDATIQTDTAEVEQ